MLVMLTKYFTLTNYTWMFCEGYYLHRLLANTFEEERSLIFILSIGWGKFFENYLLKQNFIIYLVNAVGQL